MHPCLGVDEIIRLLASELLASEAKATAVSLACCCKNFEDPVLDVLWEAQDGLAPLLKCLPREVWKEDGGILSFKRIPTKEEWTDFQKHTRRIRRLKVDTFEDPITSDVLLALQLRTVNVPLLPRLKTFECEEATETFIPFIPLFLSPNTTEIHITSVRRSPIMVTAPMISRFSTLCPDLETITLNELPRDSVITAAVSEMLLACNRNALQEFQVDSPLTEDARGVVCQLPRLSSLWIVIQGSTPLPTLALPNLVDVDVEYDDYLYWLQGFHGARLEKLESACFRCYSKQIGDFLGEFERVALTTSAHNTLSSFRFCTSRSWNPNYSSLLSFKQLKELEIEFSCNGGCSSRVDDDVIISLARAMPKLEILQLGGAPCKIPTGVTVNGLICLAYRCSRLSKLRIHFQVTSLVRTATSAATESPSNDGTVVRRGNCALTNLEVGDIPIPVQSAFTVALILLQIFPRISDVEFTNGEWRTVAETIKHFRQIGAFVHRSGGAIGIGHPEENSRV